MDDDVELLKRIYDRFNARDIDGVLTVLTDDVAWANGMDGGHVHGREAVREYWTRQWTMVSPHVEPVGFHRTADGAIIAEVRQSVRDLEGKPLQGRRTGLKTRRSDTFSVFERARWLASTPRMLPEDTRDHWSFANRGASGEGRTGLRRESAPSLRRSRTGSAVSAFGYDPDRAKDFGNPRPGALVSASPVTHLPSFTEETTTAQVNDRSLY